MNKQFLAALLLSAALCTAATGCTTSKQEESDMPLTSPTAAGDSTQDNVPPTADTTHIFLYVMVLVAASSLLAGLALARKKHPR